MHSDLFAFDLDGTLVHPHSTKGRSIPTGLLQALDQIASRAHILVATGRRFRAALEDMKDMPHFPYAVVNNGLVVKDDHGRTVFRKAMDLETGLQIAEAFEKLGSPYLFVIDGFEEGIDFLFIEKHLKSEYTAVKKIWDRNYRFSMALESLEKAEGLLAQLPLLEVMSLGSIEEMKSLEAKLVPLLPEGIRSVLVRNIGWPGWSALEIGPREISKWSGVDFVRERLQAKRVIAVGDDENDREMLEFANLSVAMSHAEEHLQALSQHQVKGPDGLAEFLSKFYEASFLGQN